VRESEGALTTKDGGFIKHGIPGHDEALSGEAEEAPALRVRFHTQMDAGFPAIVEL